MKCTINENNEITNFWREGSGPKNTIDCDKLPSPNIVATGPPYDQTLLYKLVSGVVTPTEAGIAYLAQQYARNRAEEFPSIPDQLDEIYHNGIDSWKVVIKLTKDKFPKG